MSSPSSLRHSVSDPNLSPKSHMFSTPSRSSTTLSSKSSPLNIVAKLKLGRKSTEINSYDLNNDEYSFYSPYYRGLLAQSLEDGSQNQHQRIQSHLSSGENNNNNDNNNSMLSPDGDRYSPYYKGLTDFSLVLLAQSIEGSSQNQHERIQSHLSSGENNNNNNNNNNNSVLASDGDRYSPYYKGLTDFSLVLFAQSLEDGSQNQHQMIQSHLSSGENNYNNNNNSVLSSDVDRYSPYYKGLTDFSLVLHGGRDLQSPVYAWQLQEVEGGYESSPYYRGLIDYTLAIHELEVGGGGGGGGGGRRGGSSLGPQMISSYTSAFAMSWSSCLRGKNEPFSDEFSTTASADTGLNDPRGQISASSPLPPPLPPPLPLLPREGSVN